MIVGKIWDCEYPWDVRVEKVCHTLLDAGHQVVLVCRNRRRAPVYEERDGVRIHRMPPSRLLPAAIDRQASFPAFFNPRWLSLALRTFRRERVDVIVSRDLPLAPLGLIVGRLLGKPVIVDVAEHYPGLLRDLYNRHDFRLGNLLLRNPAFAALLERRTLPRADGVWVVVEEMADRLAALGVRRDRIALVSNTPLPERVARLGARPRRTPDPGGLRVVYLGNVERSRGLDVALEALARFREGPLRPTLDVFGDGKSFERDRASAAVLGLADRVTFHGRRPYDEVLDRLGEFDVGLIPHHATDHWNYTIQNKFFDYMAAGLPVVASAMPPARRLLEQTGAGMVFRDRDPDSLAAALRTLADPATRRRLGDAGRRAVERELNWGEDGRRLLQSLERTVRPARRVPPEPVVGASAVAP
ncbi:MAG: glycosyltransferase family 4 protein [Gemmatimonadales bacterium]